MMIVIMIKRANRDLHFIHHFWAPTVLFTALKISWFLAILCSISAISLQVDKWKLHRIGLFIALSDPYPYPCSCSCPHWMMHGVYLQCTHDIGIDCKLGYKKCLQYLRMKLSRFRRTVIMNRMGGTPRETERNPYWRLNHGNLLFSVN
jgi:hypothetical protein